MGNFVGNFVGNCLGNLYFCGQLLSYSRRGVDCVVIITYVGHVIVEIFEFCVNSGTFWTLVRGSEMYHHVLVTVDSLSELFTAQCTWELSDVLMKFHVSVEIGDSGEHLAADTTTELLVEVLLLDVLSHVAL